MLTLSTIAKMRGFVSRDEAIKSLPPALREEGRTCETFIIDFKDLDESIAAMKHGEFVAVIKDLERLGRVRLPYKMVYLIIRGSDDESCVRQSFYTQETVDKIQGWPALTFGDDHGKVVSYEYKERLRDDAETAKNPVLRAASIKYHDALSDIVGSYGFYVQFLIMMLNIANVERHDVTRNTSTISSVPSEKRRWGRSRYTYLCPPDFGLGNGENRKHNSPRPHLRRGHFKNVRCGSGRLERRQVWVEPCFVMGTPEEPREAYVS